MSNSKRYPQIERRIGQIKAEISSLGPLRPGTLSKQYNVCGRPDCSCKHDPPRKHGPYYKISYTWHRRSKSEFVRDIDIDQIRAQLDSYQRLRSLIDEWLALGLEWARLEREERKNVRKKLPRSAAPARQSKAKPPRDVSSRTTQGRR